MCQSAADLGDCNKEQGRDGLPIGCRGGTFPTNVSDRPFLPMIACISSVTVGPHCRCRNERLEMTAAWRLKFLAARIACKDALPTVRPQRRISHNHLELHGGV
jgi:hypothetical protein